MVSSERGLAATGNPRYLALYCDVKAGSASRAIGCCIRYSITYLLARLTFHRLSARSMVTSR